MAWTEIFLAFCVCIPSLTSAYPTGADESACSTLNPSLGHLNTHPQDGASPFEIPLSSNAYTPGGPALTVTLESRSCPGTKFRGFLLTARHADTTKDQTEELGSFDTPLGTRHVCTGAKSRTHTDNNDKTSLVFQWTPPSEDQGPVVFRATFVQIRTVFWVDIHSDIVQSQTPVHSNLISPKVKLVAPGELCVTPTATTQDTSFPKDSACGGTKGCFSVCNGDACEFLMTWAPETDDDTVQVTLKAYIGDGDRYLAFGLSTDQKMSNDSVTECVHSTRSVAVFNSWNEPYYNMRLDDTAQNGLTLQSVSFEDGTLTCSFYRAKTGPISKVYNLDDTKYYIFLARGSADSDGVLQHDAIPLISSERVSVVDITVDITP